MSESLHKEISSKARDELGESQPLNRREGEESERSGSRADGSRGGGVGRSSPKRNKAKVLAFNSRSIQLGTRSRSCVGGEAERGGARGGAGCGGGVRGASRGKKDKRGGGAPRPGLGGSSLRSPIGTGRCLTERRRDSTGGNPSPFGGRSSLTPRSPVKKAERNRKTPPEGGFEAEQRRKVRGARGGAENEEVYDLTGTDEQTSSEGEGAHSESEPTGTVQGVPEAEAEGGGGEPAWRLEKRGKVVGSFSLR